MENFNKIWMQNVEKTYKELLSQYFNTLLNLSKVVVVFCDHSTNSQTEEQIIDYTLAKIFELW